MEILETPLAGLKIIKLDLYQDDRGFFVERFTRSKFAEFGLDKDFIQDNHSMSQANIVRGLHYQHDPVQEKLVGCVAGKIFDVAVDIRKDSPTFGKNFGIILDQATLLWIPGGFAHGFCNVSTESAHLFYKISGGEYNAAGEGGIMWNDPELNIAWPVAEPIISARDAKQQSFAQYKNNPKF